MVKSIQQRLNIARYGLFLLVTGLTLSLARSVAAAPTVEEMWHVIQQQQRTIEALQARLDAGAAAHGVTAPRDQPELGQLQQRIEENSARIDATASLMEQRGTSGGGWWDRTSVGGYGSARFEAATADKHETGFTHRRFVLAVNSQWLDRLQTYFELEFEHFTQLELEKNINAGGAELELSQAVEGSNDSEISIEQAWARYSISPALNLDFGAVLVPVGRFNLRHDDNQWLLPRRSLVDRGAPVLPVTAAWTELGAGVSGTAYAGGSLLDYRLYVLNGSSLDFELENELEVAVKPGATELESITAAEFGLVRGAFDGNSNDSLAFAGRLALRPAPGQEIAVSGYFGNYVPSFLGTDASLWSLAVDGLHHVREFEIEYQAVTTRFENLMDVADAFAGRLLFGARETSGAVEDAAFATQKIEFGLSGHAMARRKSGYWIELRRPFWPEALNDTFLGRGFNNPQLIPVLRMEQVFFDDQLQGMAFDGGKVSAFETRNARINRATIGLGYRPVPDWVLSLAGEYTWTGARSLAGLTNYLAAGEREDDNFSLLLGAAFGF